MNAEGDANEREWEKVEAEKQEAGSRRGDAERGRASHTVSPTGAGYMSFCRPISMQPFRFRAV